MRSGVILMLFGIVFMSCNTTRQLNPPPTLDDSKVYLGTIKLGDACGTLIEINHTDGNGDRKELIRPMNLESKFEIEGLRLKFRYTLNTQKKTKTCNAYICVDLLEQYAVR